MELHDVVTNDYVQLLVAASGIATFILLAIQADRFIIRPILSLIRDGYKKTRKNSRDRFELEVDRASTDHSSLLTSLTLRIFQLLVSIVTVISSAVLTIIAAIMYIPDYGRGEGITAITLGMSSKNASIISVVMGSLALLSFLYSGYSMLKFLRAVLGARQNQK